MFKGMVSIKKQFKLSAEGIDAVSEFITEELGKVRVSQKDILRLRLSVEEILLDWQKSDKTEKNITIELTKRFKRINLTVSCVGARVNPLTNENSEDYGGSLLGRAMLENLGLSPSWSYRDGVNIVSAAVKISNSASQVIHIAVAVAMAIILGYICGFMPQTIRDGVLTGFLDSLFNTFLDLLSCIVGPMIFLSIAWGIFNIGDTKQLGIIGKKLLMRFLFVGLLVGVFSMAFSLLVWRIKPTASVSGENIFSKLFEMLLGIIPVNIVSPFVEGNTLQILFLGALTGVAMIILSNRIPTVSQAVKQANTMVQFLITGIGALVPYFIFLSLFRLMLRGTLKSSIGGILLVVLVSLALSAAELIVEGLCVAGKDVKFKNLVRKITPVFLVAISTASSTITYPKTVNCCKKEMGINKKLLNFAIPFGTCIFMAHTVNVMIVITMFSVKHFGVGISAETIIMCVFTALILSVAAPPVPAGTLTCYTLLFTQMGIPLEALTIAVAADILLDFSATAGDTCSLIFHLTNASRKLGMCDEYILKR